MANINFVSATGGLWSIGGNWDGGSVPSTNDIAIFSTIYGSGNITIDQNIVCSGVTISGNYNGNMTAAGYGYYLTGNYVDDGTGTRNLGSGMIMNGPSSRIHLGSTLGAATATSCAVTMNTNTSGVLDINKSNTIFKTITINGTVFSFGMVALGITNNTTALTLTNNSIFTDNGVGLQIRLTSSATSMSLPATYTYNGVGYLRFNNGANTITHSIPALNYTGSGDIVIMTDYNAPTFNLSGNLITNGNITSKIESSAGAGVTYVLNTNGYAVTCKTLDVGNSFATGTYTANLSNSQINCTSFPSTLNHATGNVKLNLQSSTINCSGNFTYGSNHTIDPGTSIVNITNTSTVTSNSKAFYDMNVNTAASGTLVTFADSPRISGDVTVTQGSTNLDGLNWSGWGDVLFDGTGNHTIGSGITLMGAGTMRLNGTLTSVISAGCYIKAMENTTFNLGTRTINRLGLTTGKTITMTAGAPILTVNTYTAADWDGVTFVSSTPTSQWGLNMVPSISVVGVNVTDSDNSTGTEINADATSVNGGNNLNWLFASVTPTTTVQLTEMRFYNPLLHREYIAKGRRVLRAVQRYIGS